MHGADVRPSQLGTSSEAGKLCWSDLRTRGATVALEKLGSKPRTIRAQRKQEAASSMGEDGLAGSGDRV